MTVDEALVVTKKLNEQLGPPIGWALALVTLAAEVKRLREENEKLIETLQEHGLLRAAGCECHLEEGDSPCRVHGDEP